MDVRVFQFNGCNKCFNETILLNSETKYKVEFIEDPKNWKEIKNYPGYKVSNMGRVKSYKVWRGEACRILKSSQRSKNNKYIVVKLCKDNKSKTFYVHKLMASAFFGGPKGLDVNHKNGIKTDNRLNNIEYVSRSENHKHAYRNGLKNQNTVMNR